MRASFRKQGGPHLALRDFIVVMRKCKVDAARVDVHPRAEDVARHHTALDVPTRTARTPR